MAIAIVNSDFKHNVRNGYTSLRYDNGCSDCKSNFPIRQVLAVDDGIDFGHAGAWDSVDSSLSLVNSHLIRDAPLINISSSSRRQMALMHKGVEIYGTEKRHDFK